MSYVTKKNNLKEKKWKGDIFGVRGFGAFVSVRFFWLAHTNVLLHKGCI